MSPEKGILAKSVPNEPDMSLHPPLHDRVHRRHPDPAQHSFDARVSVDLYPEHQQLAVYPASSLAACQPALFDYNSGHDGDNSSGGRQGPAVRGA